MDFVIGQGAKMATRDFMKKQGLQANKEYQAIGNTVRPITNVLGWFLTGLEFVLPFIPGVGLIAEAGAFGLHASLSALEGTFENADDILNEASEEQVRNNELTSQRAKDKQYGERFYEPIQQQDIKDIKLIYRKS